MDISGALAIPWVFPVLCGSIIAIVAIVANATSECVSKISETNLKRMMVEQGYTPSQIETVLAASSDNPRHTLAAGKPPKASPLA